MKGCQHCDGAGTHQHTDPRWGASTTTASCTTGSSRPCAASPETRASHSAQDILRGAKALYTKPTPLCKEAKHFARRTPKQRLPQASSVFCKRFIVARLLGRRDRSCDPGDPCLAHRTRHFTRTFHELTFYTQLLVDRGRSCAASPETLASARTRALARTCTRPRTRKRARTRARTCTRSRAQRLQVG